MTGDEPVTTYDEARRRGACSCGRWRVYDVTRDAYERAARRHLGWHAQRERRATPPRPSAPADDFGVFAREARAIADLPTIDP